MNIADFGVIGGMMSLMMSVMMTVMIYLDRSRRADLTRVEERLDRLTAVVADLVKTVGELKGRFDVSNPVEALSASD